MIGEGNSYSNGDSLSTGARDPEATEREGCPLMWGWQGFQKTGNAL